MLSEHTGTHMDAPAHTWETGIHMEEVGSLDVSCNFPSDEISFIQLNCAFLNSLWNFEMFLAKNFDSLLQALFSFSSVFLKLHSALALKRIAMF